MNNSNLPYIVSLLISAILYGVAIQYILSVLNKNKEIINSEKFSRKKKFRMIYNLLIRTGDIRNITFVLILLGFITLVNFAFLGNAYYEEETPDYYLAFTWSISFFIMGLAGYIQYIRREAPWNWYIEKSSLAKISGLLTLIFFWGVSLAGLIYGFFSWFK